MQCLQEDHAGASQSLHVSSTCRTFLAQQFFREERHRIERGKAYGKLVEVKDGRGYRLARLTHSHGWLPETYQLLKDMGNDFADALEGTASEGAVFG